MYEEFINPDNGYLYVWVEGPVELLDMEIPVEAQNSTKPDGSQKTAREYLTIEPYISRDGTKAIILLNEILEPRRTGVTEENIALWDAYLTPLGLGYATGEWMGLDASACDNKVSAKLIADYFGEEVI